MESETKRIKRAEESKKTLFTEIKKLLESKSDDEHFLPGQLPSLVADVRQSVKDKRVFRFLFS